MLESYSMSRQDFNFYPNLLPQVNDLVMVKVTKIDDLMIYVSLLEYNNIQGTVMLKELTKNKRIKSLRKIVRLDNQEVLKVINIDPSGDYIDLSRNLVTPEEKDKHLNYYYQGTVIHSIATYLSIQLDKSVRNIYETYLHYLYPKKEEYDTWDENPAYLKLEKGLDDFDSIFGEDIYKPIKNNLQFIIGRKFQNQVNEYRTSFKLQFYSPEGNGLQNLKDTLTIDIDATKSKLEETDERMETVKISESELITNCPQYEIILKANRLGEEILNQVLQDIQKKATNAVFQIINKPQINLQGRHSGKQKIAMMGHGNTI